MGYSEDLKVSKRAFENQKVNENLGRSEIARSKRIAIYLRDPQPRYKFYYLS